MAPRCPPGYRFHPTDEELLGFYLKKKINNKNIDDNPIAEVDLYKYEPRDLPEMSNSKGNDQEWYFFCARDKKYPNGFRANRATERGYWKSTGRDRAVKCSISTGSKKTLVYYVGRAPHGKRTDWVMHEYRMEDKVYENLKSPQEAFVLVRVYKKSGSGPKNGEQYGAPFVEEPDSPLAGEDDEVPPQPERRAETSFAPQLEYNESEIDPVVGNDTGLKDLEDYLSNERFETNDSKFASDNPDRVLDDLPRFEVDDYTLEDFINEQPEADYTPSSAEDGLTLEDFINEQPQADGVDDSWKEGVINNVDDIMFSDDFFGGESDNMIIPQNWMDLSDTSVGPAEFSTDDFLEINDLSIGGGVLDSLSSNISAGEREGLGSRGSEIQLRPRRNSPMQVQFDPQGDTARRMLLMRHSESQQNDSDRILSSSRIPCSSASSQNLLEFAERATSSLGPQRLQGEGCPVDGDLLSMAREDTGDLSDTDFWRNFVGTPPSSSSVDPQDTTYPSHEGTYRSEVDVGSSAADSASHYWQTPDCPPSSTSVAESTEKPSGKLSARISSLLSPILPASAAELPSFSNTYVRASETHVTALTITCSCSENGAKTVQAVVMNIAGGKVHQEMMSGKWKPCAEDCKQQSCVQCSQRRTSQRPVAKGSKSGFVFVFLLGVASTIIWILLLRGSWRIARFLHNLIL